MDKTCETRSPYMGDFVTMPAADRMNRSLLVRGATPPRGSVLMRVYAALKDFQTHKWMYDAESRVAHVRSIGFVETAGDVRN